MALKLEGSCHCGAVHFSVVSHTPYPYQLCYCSICRKTAGGGGFAINLMGDAGSLKVKGHKAVRIFHAEIKDSRGHCEKSTGQRHFCSGCATALWLYDPEWPDLVHPFASAVDTRLPVPPSKTHIMLKFKAPWVKPDFGRGDKRFALYPKDSIEEWHRKRGLWQD
ncbi:MAG TPA: GFA family protein [Rhizomicrobium sp.]|nr:GFA family protein [Rhizomicrobium sp.]